MRVDPAPADIRAAFDLLKGEPGFTESGRLVASGKLPVQMLQAMALRPQILRGFAYISNAAYPGGILERRLKELVILEASRRNACQFCFESHKAMVRMAGLAEDALVLLDSPDQHTPRERLALEYARAVMNDSNRIRDELFERLKAAFNQSEIVELTFVIGLINMLNLFNNALQVRYGDDYEKA